MGPGLEVAASTIRFLRSTPSFSSPPTPSICTRSSDLTRRLASCSLLPPRWLASESISSMKMVEGAWKRAMSKSSLTWLGLGVWVGLGLGLGVRGWGGE